MLRRPTLTALLVTVMLLAGIASVAFARPAAPPVADEAPAKFEITTGGGLHQHPEFEQFRLVNTARGVPCLPLGEECGP